MTCKFCKDKYKTIEYSMETEAEANSQLTRQLCGINIRDINPLPVSVKYQKFLKSAPKNIFN